MTNTQDNFQQEKDKDVEPEDVAKTLIDSLVEQSTFQTTSNLHQCKNPESSVIARARSEPLSENIQRFFASQDLNEIEPKPETVLNPIAAKFTASEATKAPVFHANDSVPFILMKKDAVTVPKRPFKGNALEFKSWQVKMRRIIAEYK